MLNGVIDLRSDTLTQPTDEMREAMARAVVGDDGYDEDPTVHALEALAGAMVGKEAALLVPSGTMANLVAMMTHSRHGEEVILEEESHTYYYESGGLSAIAGLTPRLVPGQLGVIQPEDVESALRPKSILHPPTTLLCLENTHNRSGGNVIRLEEMATLREVADRHNLAVHLDGARIFNAALALGVDASAIGRYADSLMFCLSKGLSAPVGSILAGRREFIRRARHNRQIVGGGMRQAGVIAAAGIVALKTMIERLRVDHEHAQLLAAELDRIQGVSIGPVTLRTNMVNVDVRGLGLDSAQFLKVLSRYGIKANGRPPTRVRFVLHRHITQEDIVATVGVVKEIATYALTDLSGAWLKAGQA